MKKTRKIMMLVYGFTLLFSVSLSGQTIKGDVNGDGNVTIVDALMTAQKYVGLSPNPFDQSASDVNCDNQLTIVDALMMAQYYVGLIGSFPACNPGTSATLYAAPAGIAGRSGTIDQPVTLEDAIRRITAGGTVYVRGGTYSYSAQITIERGNNGTAGSMTKIFAYGSEKPILDFSGQSYTSNDVNPRGVRLDANYWYMKGLEITGAADNGMYVSGNYNKIELCVFHHNRDSGLQLGRYSEDQTAIADWPSYNTILNCDSFENDDPDNHEDADGFACKLTTGNGNTFRGCVAHHNNDDGWDLFMKPETGVIGPVTLENCIAYANGYYANGGESPGDGNGFKLGGNGLPCDHVLTRCIAFGNKVKGFWGNGNGGSMTVTNCTGFDNRAGANLKWDKGTHVFRNNLSYYSPETDYHYGTDVENTNCWWKSDGTSVNGKGLAVDASDFISLTPAISRGTDGSINTGNFLKLSSSSDLVNAGTPAGTDIGAIESY